MDTNHVVIDDRYVQGRAGGEGGRGAEDSLDPEIKRDSWVQRERDRDALGPVYEEKQLQKLINDITALLEMMS